MRQRMVATVLVGLVLAGCTSTAQKGPSLPQAGQTSSSTSNSSPSSSSTPPSTASRPSAGPSTTQGPAVRVPTLRILSPKSDAQILLPAAIRYQITGLEVGRGRGHLHAYVGNPDQTFHIELPLSKPSGVAYLPDDKQLSGRRDVTFRLATADHRLLTNPEAGVTIRNLLLMGSRSG